jgi:putative NADH-flavin reductase
VGLALGRVVGVTEVEEHDAVIAKTAPNLDETAHDLLNVLVDRPLVANLTGNAVVTLAIVGGAGNDTVHATVRE